MGGRAISAAAGGGRRPATLDSFVVPHWLVQQNSWVEDPQNSDSAAYNYPILLRIHGSLDREALRSSLDELIQRHAPLRSVFDLRGKAMMQFVLAAHGCPLETLDLASLDESERETKTREIVDREIRRPFCLTEEIPFRATLFSLDSEEHELLIVTHHVVYDDWSNGVLIREISAMYRAFAKGQPSPLADLPAQYGAFARWCAKKVSGVELRPQFEFWKAQLGDGANFHHLRADFAGFVPATTDSRDRACPGTPRSRLKRGAREKVFLNEQLTSALTDWSRRQYASLFMTLTAGFQCLLHRCSGDQEVAVGTCVANRPQVELESLIGRFGNHLILRTNLAGNPSFQETVERVREAALTAYGYQEVPFGEVLEMVRGGASARCDRVVQAMFVFQNAPKGEWDVPGLDVRSIPVKQPTAKYDLTVWLRKTDGIEITLEYNTDLFRAGTIQTILQEYRGILETMVESPRGRITEYLPNARNPRNERVALSANCAVTKDAVDAHASIVERGNPASNDEMPLFERSTDSVSGNGRPRATTDEIEGEIARIWRESLNGLDAEERAPSEGEGPAELMSRSYFDLGGDSLGGARMLARIEKRFRLRIPLAALLENPTIAKLAEIVREQGSNVSWRSLVRIQATGSRVPLFLFHGAGGNVVMYRDLARYLDPDQPMYGLQCQGLDGYSAFLTRIEEMASAYLRDIRSVQRTGPYLLGGYCMGGTIAFEAARQLHAMGEEIALLIIMDTPNWAALPKESVRSQLYFEFEKIATRSRRFLQRDIRASLKCFQGRAATRDRMAQADGDDLPGKKEANEQNEFDVLRRLWDVNERAALAYEPRVYPGRIVQFRPAWQYARYRKAEQSWEELAQGGVEVHELPVHPGEMLDEPFVQQLAAELKALTRGAAHTPLTAEPRFPPRKGGVRLAQ